MTDMPGMLFPPLDDESDTSQNQLPHDIQDRFSKVRSLLREKALTGNADVEEAEELKRKQHAAALEAAHAVQLEVTRLQDGIAELEAMYALACQRQSPGDDDEESYLSDEDDDGFGGLPEVVGDLPVEPSMVRAVVELDYDRETSLTSGSNGDDCDRPVTKRVINTHDVLCCEG